MDAAPDALTEEQQIAYLRKYSYPVTDAFGWDESANPQLFGRKGAFSEEAGDSSSSLAVAWPELDVGVTGHHEKDKHTWYILDCALMLPGRAKILHWVAEHRLAHFRERLHDPVRRCLGDASYDEKFRGSPFALRGGPSGTTARLRQWISTLASCANEASCPPSVACLALRFLAPPEPPASGAAMKSAANSAAGRLKGALGAAKGKLQPRLLELASEAASSAAVGFAKQNPQAAKATMGYVGANPAAAQAAGQVGGKDPSGERLKRQEADAEASRVVDEVSAKIAEVLAATRGASKKEKQALLARKRELENSPAYLDALRYLEDPVGERLRRQAAAEEK